jgi:hypothetical protein
VSTRSTTTPLSRPSHDSSAYYMDHLLNPINPIKPASAKGGRMTAHRAQARRVHGRSHSPSLVELDPARRGVLVPQNDVGGGFRVSTRQREIQGEQRCLPVRRGALLEDPDLPERLGCPFEIGPHAVRRRQVEEQRGFGRLCREGLPRHLGYILRLVVVATRRSRHRGC